MKLNDVVKKMFKVGGYQVCIPFDGIEDFIQKWSDKQRGMAFLDLNPSFQRSHVWTKEQQIKYVEFKLAGGTGSDVIYFNCKGWMNNFEGPFVIVDGKQRLEAIRLFIRNDFKVFGHYLNEFDDSESILRKNDLIFNVNNLSKMNDVLEWYLQINTGGTPHTKEEIEKVMKLIKN